MSFLMEIVPSSHPTGKSRWIIENTGEYPCDIRVGKGSLKAAKSQSTKKVLASIAGYKLSTSVWPLYNFLK